MNDSYVIGFVGRRGAGKTLSATAWAYSTLFSPLCLRCHKIYRFGIYTEPSKSLEDTDGESDKIKGKVSLKAGDTCPNPRCNKELTNNKKLGYKVLSNYQCSFSEIVVEDLAGWIAEFPTELERAILLSDELPSVAHAYRGQSRENMLVGSVIEQIRKRDVSVFYTAQNPRRIDSSIYWQTDFIVRCNSKGSGRAVELEWFDQYAQFAPNATGDGVWDANRNPDAFMVLEDARWVWNLYDTKHIVKPTEWYRKEKEENKSGSGEFIQIDTSTPEGDAQMKELDRIFNPIGITDDSAVDYRSLKMRFKRRKLPEQNLLYEIQRRGLTVVDRGGKQMVMKELV